MFTEPSFLEGVGSVLDLGATMQDFSALENERTADMEAMRNDWRKIGDDMRLAMEEHERSAAGNQ